MRQDGGAKDLDDTQLLESHPIDRQFQNRVDPEDQFEVYQLAELQERFALAHKLAHYLNAIDRSAFEAFTQLVLDEVRRTDYAALDRAVLRTHNLDPHGAISRLFDNDLDPYAWYLHPRLDDNIELGPWPDLADEVRAALNAFEITTAYEREEVVCDVLGAVSVTLAAHQRQSGWSTAMAAACSRLALSNLRAILGIDAWVGEEGARTPVLEEQITTRERCMNAFLPVILPAILDAHGRGRDAKVNDLHLVMHLVEERFVQENSAALNALDWAPPDEHGADMTEREIVLRSGFLHLRPPPDHRAAAGMANEPLFDLGIVQGSDGVYARYSTDVDFAKAIDDALIRHQRGDWKHLPRDDKNTNLRGLYEEFEPPTEERVARRRSIWSVFEVGDKAVFVITSGDRTTTDVLFSSEY